jgi:hypothetical protein
MTCVKSSKNCTIHEVFVHIVCEVSAHRYRYALGKERGAWWLIRSDGWEFPLDHDRRHQRLFLSDADEREVGVEGIAALERMTRQVLTRERDA